ncbi:hypothetical protein EC844_11473 [Acinetobacter calcoaceticus]|uniref:DUF6160 domain-containing protein n=1 Tax=Acinetobacter calcoaceticus TaxID=471 RepID=A0A4R1XNR8_ACICA|nr:hypothetical protein EC844_11473 [Acinetobacter calcoaceticus]
MKKMKNKAEKKLILSTLTSCIIASISQAHALQAMSDTDMRAVDGQDGINASINYENVSIDKVAWIDQSGKATGEGEQSLAATFGDIKISRGSLAADKKLGANLSLDIYSSVQQGAQNTGLKLSSDVTLGKISTGSMMVCKDSSCSTDASMGSLQIESYNPIQFNLLTTNGLFNRDSKTYLDLGIKNLKIGISQKDQNKENILAMKDFNFNLKSEGYMYLDPENGITLATGKDGFANFIRDEITGRPGINLEFTVNNKGLMQAGASGEIRNGLVQFGATAKDNNVLGKANTRANAGNVLMSNNQIAGSTGIKLKVAGEFTNDGDNINGRATTLELGGGGSYAYGFRFENITSLRTRNGITGNETGDIGLTTQRAGLEMDGIYINLVDSHQVELPQNEALMNTYLGTTSGAKAVKIANASDFIQTIANTSSINPASAVISLRNVDFVALSRRGQFIATPDVTDARLLPSTTPAKWGLGLPIYNLNSNLAFYAKKSDGKTDFVPNLNGQRVPNLNPVAGSERIGFSASISTQGVNKDGSKSTSILLIDGADNKNYANNVTTPTDYYIGLRNIDMLLNGYGSIGFEDGQLNVSMPDLKMIMSAQLAAGYLPGAKYKSCPSTGGCYAPSNNFASNYDVLSGIKIRLAGDINFALVPRAILTDQFGLLKENVNALNIVGIMNLNSSSNMNNAIQIVDVDGSTLGIDNLSGSIGFDNNLIINKDNVGFHYSFVFNPKKKPEGVFRARDVNLYPATTENGVTAVGNPQRLGEIAITGGRLDANLTLTPRDTPFIF